VLAAQEGANIAEALGPRNKCAILQNHGLLTLGHTVDEAAYLFSALDKQCKVQLLLEAAAANGINKTVIDDEDAAFTASTIQ
jgi:ribulose-5-phosphate 4-epimerase/fuculose-1-phosphate aldolase